MIEIGKRIFPDTAEMAKLNAMSDDHSGSGRKMSPDDCIAEVGPTDKAARSTELAELLYLLKLGVKTNLRWLGREIPDIDAAQKTSARLCEYVERLEALIGPANQKCSERS